MGGLKITTTENTLSRVENNYINSTRKNSIIIQAFHLLPIIVFLILIHFLNSGNPSWYFTSHEEWFKINIYNRSEWQIYSSSIGYGNNYRTFESFADFVLTNFDMTLHYYQWYFIIYLIGISFLLLGVSYWLVMLYLRFNSIITKKSLPGLIGGIPLLIGSNFIIASYFINVRLNRELNLLARKMANHTSDGSSTYTISFILYGAIYLLCLSSFILARKITPLTTKKDELTSTIDIRKNFDADKKKDIMIIIVSYIIALFLLAIIFAIGLFFYNEGKKGYIIIAIAYAISSLIMGVACRLIFDNKEKLLINTFRVVIFYEIGLGLITSLAAGPDQMKLWELITPWMGVLGTSLTIIIIANLMHLRNK